MSMQHVPVMECGDGFYRADNGAKGKAPVAKTASYTILPTQAGTIFTNAGASGSITFTLPSPKKQMWFGFLRAAAQDIVITATGGAKINGGSANGSYTMNGGGLAGALRYHEIYSDGTDWFFVAGGPPVKVFVSTEQTGTGSAQNVAHGLGVTPTQVFVAPTDLTPATVGSYAVTEGTHTSTNVVVTVTASKKFKVMAFV